MVILLMFFELCGNKMDKRREKTKSFQNIQKNILEIFFFKKVNDYIFSSQETGTY